MSLASQLTLAFQRIGTEFKSVRSPGAWTAPAYQNGYQGLSGIAAAYRKDGLKNVQFHGLMQIPSAGNTSTCFVLPAGFLPSMDERFALIANEAFAEFKVSANGTCQILSNSSGWIDLSGVSFLAEG